MHPRLSGKVHSLIRGHDRPVIPSSPYSSAFTLVELLAVIAIIGVLASLLLSSLVAARQKAQGVLCMSNVRQLVQAWWLYADDNDERLPGAPGWVSGRLNFNPGNPDNTNVSFLIHPRFATLAPYTVAAGIYKCPADQSSVIIRGRRHPRVRSVAMNAFLGDDELPPDFYRPWVGSPPFRRFPRRTDLTDPGPSRTWTFVDEHPDSINDGGMCVKCDAVRSAAIFVDYPSSQHNGACGFAFADGHAEIKRWLDPRTRIRPAYTNKNNIPSPNNRDIAWMQERSSSLQR